MNRPVKRPSEQKSSAAANRASSEERSKSVKKKRSFKESQKLRDSLDQIGKLTEVQATRDCKVHATADFAGRTVALLHRGQIV